MNNINITYVNIEELKPATYNPRKWDKVAAEQLKESIKRHGLIDPLIVNNAKERKNVLIGGHFRLKMAIELGHTSIPVVYLNIPEIEREKELNLRLNKNVGEFDLDLLKEYDEDFLKDVGFSSEELDDIFVMDEEPEVFDLKKELEKLSIGEIKVKEGNIYELNGSKLMCGNSMNEEDILKLMGDEKADMCFTDPPYILDYLKGKKKSETTEGFGYKRDRRYLGTDTLPDNFTELWVNNVAKVQKENFSIIIFENWKNIRTIWDQMEKHWKVRNMIVWHLPNRTQGFAAKGKFFNKHDIAMVGSTEGVQIQNVEEEELLENEYLTALYAISGKPHWEAYEKNKKFCPTDHIDYKASDQQSSGQGIIFGTKPVEILIPYIKVLTKRHDLILEPYGGSGSTLIAAITMDRRCYVMEKCPTYAEVILNRWARKTGQQPKQIM